MKVGDVSQKVDIWEEMTLFFQTKNQKYRGTCTFCNFEIKRKDDK